MPDENTTVVVQRYLEALAGEAPAQPIIRTLLERSVRRLQYLCASLLYHRFPRLTRPPLNLRSLNRSCGRSTRMLTLKRQAKDK